MLDHQLFDLCRKIPGATKDNFYAQAGTCLEFPKFHKEAGWLRHIEIVGL